MPERINISGQQKCAGHSHRQEQSCDDEYSTQHLDEWRRRCPRFFRRRCRQRNSEFSTECVTFFDLCQAFQNFPLKRDEVLRAFVGTAMQHVGEQILQRLWKPAQVPSAESTSLRRENKSPSGNRLCHAAIAPGWQIAAPLKNLRRVPRLVENEAWIQRN